MICCDDDDEEEEDDDDDGDSLVHLLFRDSLLAVYRTD